MGVRKNLLRLQCFRMTPLPALWTSAPPELFLLPSLLSLIPAPLTFESLSGSNIHRCLHKCMQLEMNGKQGSEETLPFPAWICASYISPLPVPRQLAGATGAVWVCSRFQLASPRTFSLLSQIHTHSQIIPPRGNIQIKN